MRRLTLTAALALIPTTSAHAMQKPTPQPPQVGEPIANLVLPTVDGSQTIALSQYKGQKVFLIVFASW